MSCPYCKTTPIQKKAICHRPDVRHKVCPGGTYPDCLSAAPSTSRGGDCGRTEILHSCDPYQAASATRLLEGFFLGALDQTPGPDEE